MSESEPATPFGESEGGDESDGGFLLVEDNDDQAHLTVQMLRRSHARWPVRRVAGGAEVLSYLRDEAPYETAARPDLVVLDLHMPNVDGLEVLRAVKADPALRGIPAVTCTSSDAEDDRARAYDSHANSYVFKPGDVGQLRRLADDLARCWGKWNLPAPVC